MRHLYGAIILGTKTEYNNAVRSIARSTGFFSCRVYSPADPRQRLESMQSWLSSLGCVTVGFGLKPKVAPGVVIHSIPVIFTTPGLHMLPCCRSFCCQMEQHAQLALLSRCISESLFFRIGYLANRYPDLMRLLRSRAG